MRFLLLMFLLLMLTACGSGVSTPTPPAAPSSATLVQVTAATPTLPALPTATPLAVATSVPSATPIPVASSTPTVTPTATPAPLVPVQLTDMGCCTQPFWSPDSREVRFIDKPAADQPVGIWGVAVAEPLIAPRFVTNRLAESTASPLFIVETGDATVIERRSDGQRWPIAAANGRSVQVSPDQQRIAWTFTNSDAPSSNQVTQLWLANLDGSNAQQVATLPRGGLGGWINNETLLISGRESLQAREQILYALRLTDGTRSELVRSERLRGQSLSPSGAWLIYYVAFEPDITKNGLWLARTDNSAPSVRLDETLFGSYQWRPCGERCTAAQDRLLLVPFEVDARYHRLLQFDPNSGRVQALTDPATAPLKIANADWRVSPDGRWVVYVENSDRNLWLLALGTDQQR